MQKVIKVFAKINIHFLYKCIFYCIFASRKEIDAKLQHYFINVQEKLLINIMLIISFCCMKQSNSQVLYLMGDRWDSNPQRSESQSDALPIELQSP